MCVLYLYELPMLERNWELFYSKQSVFCVTDWWRFSFWVHLAFFVWKLTINGLFTVKSMYKDMMNGHTWFLRKYLWKLKIPVKIKVFVWFLNRKVLQSKDNIARRKWQGCTKCSFCGSEEMVEHFFISCPFAKVVWDIIYSTYNITPPTNITNMFGNWLNKID